MYFLDLLIGAPAFLLLYVGLKADRRLRRWTLALHVPVFVYFMWHMNVRSYDLIKHMDVINYWRSHWVFPLPKGAEYAQAPLYYMLAGKLFALLELVLQEPDCFRLVV